VLVLMVVLMVEQLVVVKHVMIVSLILQLMVVSAVILHGMNLVSIVLH